MMNFTIHRTNKLAILAGLFLPSLAALGPHLGLVQITGGHLFAFRVVCLLLFPLSIAVMSQGWWSNYLLRRLAVCGYVWIVWGIASVLWAPDIGYAIRDVLAVVFGFMVILILCNLRMFKTDASLHALRKGWVLAYVLTAVVAVWEMVTGDHLPGRYVDNVPSYVLEHYVIVSSTFGNPNNYGGFLLLCFPFLIWSYSISNSLRKGIYVCLIAFAPVLVIVTGSRLAFIGLCIELIVYSVLTSRRLRIFVLVSVLAVSVILLGTQLPIAQQLLAIRKLSAMVAGHAGVRARLEIMLNGLWAVYASAGIGLGAGGFTHMLSAGEGPFWIGSKTNAHNFAIEVLSQYGVIVFGMMVGWFLLLLRVCFGVRNAYSSVSASEDALIRNHSRTILTSISGYAFASMTGSSYLKASENWMWIGTIAMLGAVLWEEYSGSSQIVRVDQCD